MNLFKDVDEDQFWLTLWTFVITGVVIIAGMIAYDSHHDAEIMERLLNEGQDPLELACLMTPASAEVPCVMLIQNRGRISEAELEQAE